LIVFISISYKLKIRVNTCYKAVERKNSNYYPQELNTLLQFLQTGQIVSEVCKTYGVSEMQTSYKNLEQLEKNLFLVNAK